MSEPETHQNSYTAILCPQCGSNHATSLEDDQYLCSSCQTIFSLNKKKISVEVTHNYKTNNNSTYNNYQDAINSQKNNRRLYIIGVIVFIGVAMFSTISSKTSGPSYNSYSSSSSNRTTDNIDIEIKDTFSYLSEGVAYASIIYGEDDASALQLRIINIKDSSIIAQNTLSEVSLGDTSNIKQAMIGNSLYVIINKKYLYEINPLTAATISTHKNLEQEFVQLKDGIAIIEEVYRGKGFKLTTANGDVYEYFPLSRRLMTTKEAYSYADSKKSSSWIYYAFFTRGATNKEKFYLQRITAAIDTSGPWLRCNKCLQLDFKEQSQGTTYFGYIPSPTNIYRDYFFTNVLEILPERNFIDPSILDEQDDMVLVEYKTTIAPDAPTQTQLIKSDGSIIAGYEIPKDSRINQGLIYNEGYIIVYSSDAITLVKNDGTTILLSQDKLEELLSNKS